jgi:Tfp pilus assembly protein PilX
MLKSIRDKKGVVLIIVLATVLIAAILANTILSFILSHYRFTHHQSSRIRAYYVSMAAMNLAQEKLRMSGAEAWTTGTYTLCKSGCTVNDSDIPYTVTIKISDPDAKGIRTVKLTTNYTYTP